MTLGSMLLQIVIGPLKLLFEFIFAMANRFGSPGISIVALSLCMNLLVLPLYRRADAIQEEERRMEEKMAPGIAHIRKTFSGDQRFMTLQNFYRKNHYSQLYALRGLLPLMLEIPFFIAAYQFLSGLQLLQNTPFGPIRDLGKPDALIALGGLRINVLPVLMTAVNLISSEIYTRGAPMKSKIQLYAMALLFLVLLYDSPAGLTLYWTLNNLFSLGKNILTAPGKVKKEKTEKKERKGPALLRRKPNPGVFFLAAGCAAILTGALIPSAVIASSPAEFLDPGAFLHPFLYILNSLLTAAGAFLLWGGIYYALGSPGMKKGLEIAMFALAGCMLVNYMAFQAHFGSLSSILQTPQLPQFSWGQKGLNLLALGAAAGVCFLLYRFRESLVRGLCLTGALAMAAMSGWNMIQTAPAVAESRARMEQAAVREAVIPLSREGKNVVMLMLDRAISGLFPCILAEDPALESSFDGFVYYPNTLSHGMSTNFGVPGIYGGYEYTPWEMNRRDKEPIPKKHNEALLVLPTLFSGAGYRVTVADPPFAGDYENIPNVQLYDDLPNTSAFVTHGMYMTEQNAGGRQRLRMRNFFCYALCETAPWAIRGTLYNAGYYNQLNEILTAQVRSGMSQATGVDPEFLAAYEVLTHLRDLTEVRDGAENNLLLMSNTATHEQLLLQEPEYIPAQQVDNREFDREHEDRFRAGPVPLAMENEYQMSHYHVNMAALRQVGAWLDALKAEGVYDNTRIIIVADHGEHLGMRKDAILPDGTDLMEFNPLLLVKDFGSRGGIRTDGSFMTNADVPWMLTRGLMDHPVNPFTGKEISEEAKRAPQKVTASPEHSIYLNRGNTFLPGEWYETQGEVLDPAAWTPIGTH